jgi:hypothetical protein
LVSAHQPRIVPENSFENPLLVEKPEVSKAYYGELTGQPNYYKIESEKEFLLYVGILAPDLEDSRTDFIVEITRDDNIIHVLDGTAHEWEIFFEEFARDSYLEGPEFEQKAGSGTYYIKVYNEENKGKYSLAVGKAESFPPGEIIKTAISLPKIKKDFFEKPAYTAFFNPLGLFLLFILLILAGIIFLIFWIIRKKKKK